MTHFDLQRLKQSEDYAKVAEILNLLIEARDALPAITLASAKLRNIDLSLAARIDEALKPWEELQDNKPVLAYNHLVKADEYTGKAYEDLNEELGTCRWCGSLCYKRKKEVASVNIRGCGRKMVSYYAALNPVDALELERIREVLRDA